MKILGLNCQGAGNTPTVRALQDVLRQCNPEVVFFSETHLDTHLAECLHRSLNMDSKIVS
jgi:hypothetical protein